MLQRRSPNGLSGWLSYTYATARDENRVTGETYDADFDQHHAWRSTPGTTSGTTTDDR